MRLVGADIHNSDELLFSRYAHDALMNQKPWNMFGLYTVTSLHDGTNRYMRNQNSTVVCVKYINGFMSLILFH